VIENDSDEEIDKVPFDYGSEGTTIHLCRIIEENGEK
jgi:hypothetical protein